MKSMTDPDITYRKLLYKHTVADLKEMDRLYQELKLLQSELDDHILNGRTKHRDKTITKIHKLNREITVTENRCRTRLGLKKL